MESKQVFENARVRLETLRGEPVAFRQHTVVGANGVSVMWSGADLDYYEELCNLEKRVSDSGIDELVEEGALVK